MRYLGLYLCLAIAGFLSCIFANSSHADSFTRDHLEPPDERFEPMYRQLLARKLFVTPANYLRIVDLPTPASQGESTVALYSKQDPDEILLTYTKAGKNIYAAALSDDPNVLNDPAIKISRCDARFPKSVAIVVKEGITRVLADTHARRKGDSIILHATETEFSIESRMEGAARGLLTPYAEGKRTSALRRLAELLKTYCTSNSRKQSELSKDIELEAKKLK